MKYLYSTILLFSFCTPFIIKGVIVVFWKINQEKITRDYCINKDKPKMCCNGKCYLVKELRINSPIEQKSTFPISLENIYKQEINLFFIDIFDFNINKLQLLKTFKVISLFRNFLLSSYLTFCFHPPRS